MTPVINAGVTTSSSTMNSGRGTLSMARMLAMNAIVCGLEFCASSAFCYIPPLLLKAGIDEQNMTLVLGVGPTLGFFLVPVIGRASDRCHSRFGRRRPFILALSVILLTALFLVPFGSVLSDRMFESSSSRGQSATVALLILGAIMLDFSCQASLTPCEALLSDASRGTDSRERCFTIYSLAVSVGGCIGYLITALDWSSSSVGEYFGSQERSVFMMLAMLYVVSCFVTLSAVHEVPLSEVQSRGTSLENPENDVMMSLLPSPRSSTIDPGYVSDDTMSSDDSSRCVSTDMKPIRHKTFGFNAPFRMIRHRLRRFTFYIHSMIAARLYSMAPDVIRRLFDVPFVLRRLAVANFCSWTAVMAFNLFYTDYVGQAVYGGNPHAPAGSELRARYDTGVRMGSWGLLLHCIASAAYAPAIEKLAARFNLRRTYLAGMATFAVAMTAMTFFKSIYVINALAWCTGFAYATLTTVPFMLVTAYHENKELYFYDAVAEPAVVTGNSSCGQPPGGRPAVSERGFGTDLATLDSAYFLSQVVLTLFMGSIVHYSGTVLAYIVVAVVMGCLACVCARRIVCDKAFMHVVIRGNAV